MRLSLVGTHTLTFRGTASASVTRLWIWGLRVRVSLPERKGRIMYCFKCGKALAPVDSDDEETFIVPRGGVIFTAHGNYGSRIWDPPITSPTFLRLYICDACLQDGAAEVRVGTTRERTIYEYRPWDPEAEY